MEKTKEPENLDNQVVPSERKPARNQFIFSFLVPLLGILGVAAICQSGKLHNRQLLGINQSES